MNSEEKDKFIELDNTEPVWDHFFTVAPLVVIGSREEEGYDLAPKHMVTPLGKENYFGFVCTPRHGTYQNIKRTGYFTVSFPRPDQVVLTSLAASPRCEDGPVKKPIIGQLATLMARNMDAPVMHDSYLFFECTLERIIDGFGEHSLIVGQISGAYVHEDSMRVSDADEQEIIYHSPMLAYLANGRFAKISESFAFPFPKDFKA